MTYVHEIAEKWLDWKKLEPIVRARQALIAEDVKSRHPEALQHRGVCG